jgi:hypothetical protein
MQLGIRILHGRAFRRQDNFTAPPVAIVNEAMARRYWGTSDVVGRSIATTAFQIHRWRSSAS